METVKQTKEEYPIKNEVNIIELTELEMEKIDLVRKLNEGYLQINNEFGRISAQALAKEVELSVVQDNLESLKKQTKQAYSDFINYQNSLNNELSDKYGNFKQNENGQLERVSN